jgi:tRNA A-37 threonylcarbamoyl transferase component Bud32
VGKAVGVGLCADPELKQVSIVIPACLREAASAKAGENGNPDPIRAKTGFLLEFILMNVGAGMTIMKDMAKSSFEKISRGEFKGCLRPDLIHSLPPLFFDDPASFVRELGGRVIKESRMRWAAIFNLPDGGKVFFKRDRTKGWAELVKYFMLPSKARKEWFLAYRLQKKNLDVPRPLGWIEKGRWGLISESYYLSEAVGSGTSLIDFLNLEMKVAIEPLAKKVKAFHDAGLFHKDLHGGNFLWDGESFFLTDLHRAEILRSVSLGQRLQNLSHLFHSLRSHWGREDFLRFLMDYFGEGSLDPEKREACLRKIFSSMEELQGRWWKSRTKRCLKESTEFSRRKEGGTTVYHRRDLPSDRIKEAIRTHRAILEENPIRLLKQAPMSVVSLVETGESKICVKEFRYPHWFDRLKENFRTSKGLRAWIAGNGLRIRNVPCLGVLAYEEKKSGLGIKESFLLMEASGKGQEMDRYLFKGFQTTQIKRLFVRTFAQWLSRLHQKEIFHRDMKACNILVSEEGGDWRFELLDLEDVRLDQKVEVREAFRTLLQLNTSIPKGITHTDRMRFYKEYCRLHPVIQDKKTFLSRLMQKSRERGVVYVTPQGVVEEKWG